jgi:urease accessory protein
MGSPAGLAGRTVAGTMIAACGAVDDGLVAACREVLTREGEAAVTRLPGMLVARYRGDESEAAREYFAAIWHHVRPAVAGREAATPRIWRT